MTAALTLPGMPPTAPAMTGAAWFSPDRRHRYTLDRCWDRDLPVLRACMLNPSKAGADPTETDNTVSGLIRKAKRNGYGGLRVVNLFALVSTDPEGLLTADDPVGSFNDDVLATEAALPGPILVGWGAPSSPRLRRMVKLRALRVLRIFGDCELRSFGVTKEGDPRHPLFVRDAASLVAWP